MKTSKKNKLELHCLNNLLVIAEKNEIFPQIDVSCCKHFFFNKTKAVIKVNTYFH